MKTFRINSLTVANSTLASDPGDINTGYEDGSGSFSVSAESATQKGTDVVFTGVVINAENHASKPDRKGYADWSENELQRLAFDALKDDYCYDDEEDFDDDENWDDDNDDDENW